ncbi:TIGR03086 family metal-binding protein [Cellulomonas sp. URHE0023]|uniref:TIGR03086 family metal-binding protein n=1 Tax=Cellulomonas sp. URHE0023 TaxID=1380354 RepID=UPI00054E37DD|nr:TIGR03086 family metal-binding protein [Cellulomonas sp. URHE0023]
MSTGFDVLDRAHAALRTTAASLVPADLTRPTPCEKWDVAQVLQHAAGDQRAYAFFLTGADGPTGDPFAPDGNLTVEPLALVGPALDASARAYAGVDPDGTAPTPLPQGVLPAQTAAGAAALDAAVHAWDIAMAAGLGSPLDNELAAMILPTARALVEPLRQWGAYAAELPAVDDGPAAELLRYLGRDPFWAAPTAR